MSRTIDLSQCKMHKTFVDWGNSIGAALPFVYDEYVGELIISGYDTIKKHVYVDYDNHTYELQTDAIKHCRLSSIFLQENLYKYNIGDVINNKTILSRRLEHRNYSTGKKYLDHIYTIQCELCGGTSELSERGVTQNKNCPCCFHRDTISKERPDLQGYFSQSDMHYYYDLTCGSNRSLEFICPNCGYRKTMTVTTLVNHGFACPICSDGHSSGEKYMTSLLLQSGVVFQRQYNSSDLYFYYKGEKCTPRYDFYLPDYHLIIEIDGEFHNDDSQKEIDAEKDKLAKAHGYQIIRIPYESQNFERLYKDIQKNIGFIINGKVDKAKAALDASTSIMPKFWEAWNDGKTVKEMIAEFGSDKSTVRRYLLIGAEAGKCDYSIHESRSRSIRKRPPKTTPIICLENKMMFKSIIECSRKSLEVFGVSISQSSISNVIYGFAKSAGGLHFMKLEDYYAQEDLS